LKKKKDEICKRFSFTKYN